MQRQLPKKEVLLIGTIEVILIYYTIDYITTRPSIHATNMKNVLVNVQGLGNFDFLTNYFDQLN